MTKPRTRPAILRPSGRRVTRAARATPGVAPADPAAAAETAAYIAQMTAELARLARSARQEMLAYFLTMACLEAEAVARGGDREAGER